ncbi:MAG: iron uptake porin [Cyanobacteria bacterium P01_F01_bin.86]
MFTHVCTHRDRGYAHCWLIILSAAIAPSFLLSANPALADQVKQVSLLNAVSKPAGTDSAPASKHLRDQPIPTVNQSISSLPPTFVLEDATPKYESLAFRISSSDIEQATPLALVSELADADQMPASDARFLSSNTHPSQLSQSLDAIQAAPTTSVFDLSDVQPTDWAFQALRSLVERYNCISGDVQGLYRGQQPLSRAEFAAGLNACFSQIQARISHGSDTSVTETDLATIQQLQAEFAAELPQLADRVTTLASRTEILAAQQFSTTTKLRGEVLFGVSGAFGGHKAVSDLDDAETDEELSNNLIFTDRLRLIFDTSFTGEDLLRMRFQTGSTPNLRDATGTSMARLGFDGNREERDIILNQLYYRFPVGQSADVTVMASGTLFDVANTVNPLLGFDSRGAVSSFGLRSPIYREEIGATGAGLSYDITSWLNLALVYLAGEANNPESGEGLFGGSYTALGQLTLQPSPDLTVGLTYTRSRNAIGIGISSAIANDPFNGESESVIGNSYGLQASWRVAPKVRIGGWVGIVDVTAIDLEDNPNANIFYYALNVGIPDLGGEGNLAGFVFGQPPRVIRNQFGLEDQDTSLHFEGFYRIQINENLAITPGVFVIMNPEHNSQNRAIAVGTIRTVFTF